ncbi:type VII secretion protein EssC [Streptococcus cristatus]|uniref:type VII secretion protein EssC n=1 Tax=Streptococcus cristatus TaxID=45634 RepID=UPI0005EE529C|nr:type VII secretion protein EssC [Streptococcus cristatus]KJQ57730.1 DNA translocase FtsK [Streptococcus cristatus]QIP48567.1 type VII secretion protein EssC [Streptococcus cristatus ATCC 51100]
MTKQVIFYTKGLRYEVGVEGDKTFLLGATEKAQVYLQQQDRPIQLKSDGEEVFYQYGEEVGLLKDGLALGDTVFYLRDAEPRVYDLLDQQELHVGSQKGALIKLDEDIELLLKKSQGSWTLTRLKGDFYRNNHLEKKDQQILNFGDEISIGSVTIKIYPDEVWLYGFAQAGSQLALRDPSRYGFYEDYPDYHRSPRIIYRSSEEKIQIAPPSKEPNKPSDELLRLIVPPLLMVGVTVLITLVQPRGIYILATVVMSIASVIFSVRGFFKNRKKYKADKKERIDLYRLYLKDKAIELARLEREQKEGMHYHFPTVLELTDLVESYNHRIYEKTSLHFDFLYYRLGLGKLPTSYQLTYGQEERSGKKDALEEEGYALYSRHKKIPDMPIPANLSHGPVGYVGPRNLVLEQLQLLVMQLATFHSYHDVQFITILPEEERDQWSWMRWLPHAKLQELNVRGFVYNQRTRDQVLNSLNQILKLRRSQKEEASHKESTLFHPHYVVLVTDEKLILDHVIMEFFTEDPTELGCSLVFVEDVMSSLSENIQTVINIKDRNTGQLVMEEGVLKETDFRLDHFPADYDKERIARTLAPLNHLQNLKSSIPDTVTFMEMYGVETFEDLQVSSRWKKNAPYKSLAVPIGLRGKDDLVQLNLHEKAHGPHGLIAGTTGSGKSETIQSYILSLAVNFHPHDVAFLLIDYKGGGMANLFKNLPHLLGTITNLDGAQSMRALASINAEIHRRERLFGEFEVNHINQYQKKFRNGEATEPLPHLFLISDEFAELKVNQPDFIKELVSIARVGRSLGVHLILATQKPSGVVDDQIWSNSRFKLALKVADRGDSMEMLHTPDAAEITQTGRAYLQVGNNEVYELFQSAWSGADYQPDKDDMGIEDHTIYLINELGQYEILNEDLSGLEEADEIKEVPTELDAIVQHIQLLCEEQNIPPVPQPWLPPLKERITLEDLEVVQPAEAWKQEKSLSFLLGMADIPQAQKQEAVSINLSKDGHVLLYGSPGTGKTTFLQSVAMDLARKHSPKALTMYLMDFGTNGLAPLSKLPQVADTMLLDQAEKISKFVRIMERELNRRKKLLSDYGVGTLDLYRQASGQEEPSIVILLDSYEAIKEEAYEAEVFKLLVRISREGLSIGVHLLMTAGRQSNLRAQLYSNFKHQLSLPQNDVSEVRSIVGSTPLAMTMEDIKGRALIKREEVDVIQLALPVAGVNDAQVLNNLRQEVASLQEAWSGQRPSAIPMVPEELTEAEFYGRASVQAAYEQGLVPLGLDLETVEPVTWNLTKGNLLYLTDKEEQMVTFVKHIAKGQQKVIVLAPKYHNLPEMEGVTILASPEEYLEGLDMMEFKVQERLEKKQRDHVATVVVYNLTELVGELNSEVLDTLAYVLEKGSRAGYGSIVMSSPALAKHIDVVSKIARSYKQAVVGLRLSDQSVLTVTNRSVREPQLEEQEHYYVADGLASKMKVLMI